MPDIISMEGQVGVGYRTRGLEDIDGIAVHYTATRLVTEREAAEMGHILIIDDYHSTPPRAWGGIGYHFLTFDSGRIYGMGSLRCQRAGVANHNRHLVHMAFVTKGIPSEAARESGRWLIGQIEEKVNNVLVIAGHRQWADASHPTDCPGEEYESWLPAMIAEEGDMATEADVLTDALAAEMAYIDEVLEAASDLLHQKINLGGSWRKSFDDAPKDKVVFERIHNICKWLRGAVDELDKRTQMLGRAD